MENMKNVEKNGRSISMKPPWPRVKLGEVCEVILGGTPKTMVEEYWGGDIPWLTPGEMGKIIGPYVRDTKRKLTKLGLDSGSSLFPARSVILSTRAPIGYVFINEVPMCTNQGCKTLIPSGGVYPEYLYYNLLGRTDELNDLGTGTTFKELATGILKSITIPLPPLAVQREIVARLERELGAVEKVAKKFEEIERAAEAEFKATLKETFDDLTQRSREAEGGAIIDRALPACSGREYPPSEASCEAGAMRGVSMKPPWPRVKLGEVCEVILGGTPKTMVEEYWGGDIPWLTPGEMGKIIGPYVRDTKRKLTKLGLDSGSSLFPARSVILSTRAPIGYVFINEVPMCTNQGCKTLIPSGGVYPEYLYYNLLGRTDELNDLGTGTTFKELATGILKSIALPLPPLPVQREIVARLDAARKRHDRLMAAAKKGREAASLWRKAILKEAFE